jgi:ABC-type transport system substrate-binding protein
MAYGKTNHATIEMDHNRPPFSDHGVREAVLRTIPYQRIIDEAYEGLAELQHGIYQPITPEYSEDGWIYAPDLERSRALVRAAGAEGTTVTFLLGRTSESPKIGALVAEALAEIGLQVKVQSMDELRPDEPPEMYLREDCSHGIADPHYDLGIDFAAPRDMPYRFFPGRRLTPRLREIRHAPAETQAEMYRQTQRELLADAICVPLAGHSFPIAYHESLDPWFMSPDYLPFSHLLFSAHRW